MPRQSESDANALAASGVETVELTEQVEQVESVAALRQREEDVLKKRHVLLRNIELSEEGNAFIYARAGMPPHCELC
jgi:hypothetical protein